MGQMSIEKFAEQITAPSPEYFADFLASYSEEADQLLRHLIHPNIDVGIQDFVDSFYSHLRNRSDSAVILDRLSHDEIEKLKSEQKQHLHFLLSAGITPEAHYKRALRVGWVHELVGLSLPMLMEAYHLYHRKIEEFLRLAIYNLDQRERLSEMLHQRLQLDIEAQIASHAHFDIQIVSLLATLDKTILDASNLADLLRSSLQAMGDFEGVAACLFSRPDAQGAMQIEAEGGQEGRSFAEALQSQRVPLFNIEANTEAGIGPSGRAWRTGQIHICASVEQDSSIRPWRAEAGQHGIRSSAAVPLFDESGHTFAILCLYSYWPGFFSAVTRAAMLRHIQQAIGHAVLHCEQIAVIPAESRQVYRQCLEDGAVLMLYQPVIDLHTGKLDCVEALARLRGAQGQLIAPAAFLPSFGSSALLRLFQLGLEQVCRDTRKWREQNPPLYLPVGINLPPEGLTQDAYRNSVFETLSRWELPARILKLEMLETKESHDIAKRDARIAEFRQAGIKIVQDDLGSGHSSLLRMDRVPFDRVKIDQGLVRSALSKPLRALDFIYHLTLLVHDFGIPVTVEGLEDDGLIEAATILGADHGQGYGIARPMLAQDLTAWNQAWTFPVDSERPRTALGALAGYLLWERKLGMLVDWPDLMADFINKPCRVKRYLERDGKSDPVLSMMLERNHIAALHEPGGQMYALTRQELIDRLSAAWLEEKK
jgi:EAL domain-containing protein (putative c-di-GMP-specific phosphodiesterase class I)